MAKKLKRPAWFKMFLHQKALIDSVSDEVAGRALKAVFQYFETGEIRDGLDQLTFAVFASIKPDIDESFDDYRKSVEYGMQGADARYNK